MQLTESPDKIQSITMELERRYSNFKKKDIFRAVNEACKKVHPMFQKPDDKELEEIKNMAESDLNFG